MVFPVETEERVKRRALTLCQDHLRKVVEITRKVPQLCDDFGMDTMSSGVTIGWAMECYEKGILKKKDLGGLEANFGNWKTQIELIKMIGERKGNY
jgi:aldehyde:ferredoxin oxidoreductase